MANKKGQVDWGTMFGYFFYAFAAIFIVMFVIVFSFFRTNIAYADTTYSKEKIDAIGDLNIFLELNADNGNNVLDIIVGSYMGDDYNKVGKLAEEYFSKSHKWIIDRALDL